MNTKTAPIIVTGSLDFKIELPLSSKVYRDSIVNQSFKVKKIRSIPAEMEAIEILKLTQDTIKDVEKCRKEIKEKPLQACRDIDEAAASFSAPLEEAQDRMKKELGEFAEIKRKEAIEEENKRQEEIKKIQAAQREEEEKIARAAKAQAEAEEAQRVALLRAESAKTEKAREQAMDEARKAQAQAQENAERLAAASLEAQKKEDAIRESLPVTTAKAANAVTKFILRYEVLDINELFANYPHVCEISEKKSAVNMLINGLQMTNHNELPLVKGLKVWREADVNTRK